MLYVLLDKKLLLLFILASNMARFKLFHLCLPDSVIGSLDQTADSRTSIRRPLTFNFCILFLINKIFNFFKINNCLE